MNLKLIGCIAMGVFVAHLALFMMAFSFRSRSAAAAEPTPVPPNFHVAEEIVVDPATNTKLVNREITVSTKLRPEVYQERPELSARK